MLRKYYQTLHVPTQLNVCVVHRSLLYCELSYFFFFLAVGHGVGSEDIGGYGFFSVSVYSIVNLPSLTDHKIYSVLYYQASVSM